MRFEQLVMMAILISFSGIVHAQVVDPMNFQRIPSRYERERDYQRSRAAMEQGRRAEALKKAELEKQAKKQAEAKRAKLEEQYRKNLMANAITAPAPNPSMHCARNLQEIKANTQLCDSLSHLLFKSGKSLQIGDSVTFGATNNSDRVVSLGDCCQVRELVDPSSVFQLSVAQNGYLQTEVRGKTLKVDKICTDGKSVTVSYEYSHKTFMPAYGLSVTKGPFSFETRLEAQGDGNVKMTSTFVTDGQTYAYTPQEGIQIVNLNEKKSTFVGGQPHGIQ